MARLLVVADLDSTLMVPLVIVDEDGGYDGQCTGCDWTVVRAHARVVGLDDAAQAAEVHLDHQHRPTGDGH